MSICATAAIAELPEGEPTAASPLCLVPMSLRKRLLRGFAGMQRPSLDAWDSAPEGCGVYGLFVAESALSDPSLPPYLRVLARKGRPVYLGKADDTLFMRLLAHAESVERARNLKSEWFELAWMALSDRESCRAGECLLLDYYGEPAWNSSGFGNKTPGNKRDGQKVSAWDTMHPGRGRGEDALAEDGGRAAVEALWVGKVATMNPVRRPRSLTAPAPALQVASPARALHSVPNTSPSEAPDGPASRAPSSAVLRVVV